MIDYQRLFEKVQNHHPLIHCITNYVTMNDVANMILAAGGSPIMAQEPKEAEEIAAMCDALVLNMGVLDEKKLEAMILAGRKANALGLPVILDPVGVGASKFRMQSVDTLLQEIKCSIIRGNASEIKVLCQRKGKEKGVDADPDDLIDTASLLADAAALSQQIEAVVLVTGVIDYCINQREVYEIRNGHSMMTRITGSGCMLDGLLGVYAGANPDCLLDASVMAAGVLGFCGEQAAKKCQGTGSFRVGLIDEMSQITIQKIERRMKIENKS